MSGLHLNQDRPPLPPAVGQSLMGPNSMNAAGALIKELKLKKALIVTDGVLHKIGATKAIVDVLTAVGVAYTVYDGTEPNPTVGQARRPPVLPWGVGGCS